MVTVYQTDDEAFDLWHKMIGLPADKIVRIGDKPGGGSDNFWQMGDTGPCGPCTEIFFDHGAHIPGGPPGSPDADGDRWVEIWNLVFMQFDRSADGKLTPLPKPSVDTGAGLERVSAVMQGVTNNYDIDIFVDLIREAAQAARHHRTHEPKPARDRGSHPRLQLPHRRRRGAVERRPRLRAAPHRAARHASRPQVRQEPDVLQRAGAHAGQGDGRGLPRAGREAGARARGAAQGRRAVRAHARDRHGHSRRGHRQARRHDKTIDGETVFKLYDTYGFPVDLTNDIARERGLAIDSAGYEAAMQKQREQSQAASKFGMDLSTGVKVEGKTEFLGYEGVSDVGQVVALLKGGAAVQGARGRRRGRGVPRPHAFLCGVRRPGGRHAASWAMSARSFVVADTQKRGAAYSHIGKLEKGEIRVGDKLAAKVDAARRKAIMANHSATHLLHAALRKVLGTHVQQKGSLVAPDRLRFDFSHFQAITPEELRRIERLVNEEIRKNTAAETREMPYDTAVAEGAIALFGEKYEKDVRVLRMGEFSMELCGGTHVARSGDIGIFKIVSEGGVAAGVRRIEAITAEGALDYVEHTDQLVKEVAGLLRGTRDDVKAKVADALERIRQLEKENRQLKDKLASGQGTDLSASARDIAGVKLVAAQVDGADAGALRNAVDQLKDKLKSAVIVLASVDATNKITLVAGVTADQTGKVKAGELVGNVAGQVGGKGGGRPDFAQAGGNNPAALGAALASVEEFVRAKLGALITRTIVQKYGGTSVGSIELIQRVAAKVAAVRERGERIAVVVSAMGDHTDRLVDLAAGISREPNATRDGRAAVHRRAGFDRAARDGAVRTRHSGAIVHRQPDARAHDERPPPRPHHRGRSPTPAGLPGAGRGAGGRRLPGRG